MEATGLQEDIREIKRDLSEIRKTLSKVAVQDEKIATLGKDLRELRDSHDRLAGEVRGIREACIERAGVIRAAADHLRNDESVESWMGRVTSTWAGKIAAMGLSAAIGYLVKSLGG